MKNGSEKHEKGGSQSGKVKVPSKTQKVVPAKKGNMSDPFSGNKKGM